MMSVEDFLKWKDDMLYPTRPIFAKIGLKLNTFRLGDKYADVTIKCEDKLFKSHRIILAAASEYFDKAFFDNVSEEGSPPTKKRKSEGVLDEIFDLKEFVVKAHIFEKIIEFVYMGSVEITTSDHWREFLQASEILKLCCVDELCIYHLKKNRLSVECILEILKIPFATKKDILLSEFCDHVAEQLTMFCRHDMFPQIPFKHFALILKNVPPYSDDIGLNCIIRWMLHNHDERLPHLGELIKIRWGDVPPATISAASELIEQTSSSTSNGPTIESEISSRTVSYHHEDSFLEERKRMVATTLLYVYIRSKGEASMNVFSIHRQAAGGDAFCPVGRIQGWQIAEHHNPWIRGVAVKNRLYNLYYGRQSFAGDKAIQNQSFYYCTAELDSAVRLRPPPVIFDDVKLCSTRNNRIYAYNQFLSRLCHPIAVRPWASMREWSEMYKYNCLLDLWFPEPTMEQSVRDACMAIHEDRLYLIGGRDLTGTLNRCVKAYDTRAGKWQNLANSGSRWFLDADCCTLNDRIYVAGGVCDDQGPVVAAYDIKANKWATTAPMNTRMQYHRMVPYTDGELWAMGSFDNGNLYNNDLLITVINTKMDSGQSNSSLLIDPLKGSSLFGKAKGIILDAVSFECR